MKRNYIFKSDRLGFRNWVDSDIAKMIEINSDKDVMEFFPATATPEQTKNFIHKMQKMFLEKGYCYFAVEELETGDFIGFTGLCDQDYISPFTPCIDIGWRLHKKYWNKGYATEGAKKCLDLAFNNLHLKSIKATAPLINLRSIHVMQKAGMKKLLEFKHPRLKGHPELENCVCYEMNKVGQKNEIISEKKNFISTPS